MVPVLDPITSTATQVKHPYRDPKTPSSTDSAARTLAVLGRRGDLGRPHEHSQSDDRRERPRVVHREDPPARRTRPSASRARIIRRRKVAPLDVSARQLSMYDPKTAKWSLIDTCFTTQHLYFAKDADNTLWTSAGKPGQRRRRLAEHEDVRADRRRGEVAGLDAAHHRHQRQRQARRVRRGQSAARSRRRTSA